MTCFTLSFNENRTAKQNMILLDNIISILESMENQDVCCRIQYDAVINEKKVSEVARKVFDSIAGKFVSWDGFNGKIKIVNNDITNIEYGVFKKGSKKKYYKISNVDLVAMSL